MSSEDLTADGLLTRLEADGIAALCRAYRKQPIPSRILQDLLALPDAPSIAAEFVAAYPLSPSHLLEALLADEPAAAVLAHLATNPRTPPQLLTRFAAHEDPAVRAQAAQHPQLPSRELVTLAEDADLKVRAALAGNPSLRLPHHALLAADPEPAVRVQLAQQSPVPAPVALALGADDCAVVRLHAIATATVEDELLEHWAVSDEEDIQLALLQRRNLPVETCHTLLRSPFARVRRQAREELDLDDVDLLFLILRGEADERAWVAAREILPRPLQSVLAQDTAEAVRIALAGNPVLDPAIARFFVGQAEPRVCAALATNPAVDGSLIEELAATRAAEVLSALAYRHDLDPQMVQLLLARSAEFRRHWAILGRTEPAIDEETARILWADGLPTVRVLAVRACPDWRRADLYDLARDPVPAVRLAVLEHPHAADELLTDYADDADAEVAARARALQAERARRPRVPARDAIAASSHPNIDVPLANPNLPDPPSAEPAARPLSKRPAAPDLFNKLKRFFT